MKPCNEIHCLNHDRDKPFNCISHMTVKHAGPDCSEYETAEHSMRRDTAHCRKTGRGRWVQDKGRVIK